MNSLVSKTFCEDSSGWCKSPPPLWLICSPFSKENSYPSLSTAPSILPSSIFGFKLGFPYSCCMFSTSSSFLWCWDRCHLHLKQSFEFPCDLGIWESGTKYMLHVTGIFTYIFHTFMMVGKYYIEHLAYMIDFGIFSIATAVPWISMVFYSPFRTEDSTGRPWSRWSNRSPGMQRKIVRDGTCDENIWRTSRWCGKDVVLSYLFGRCII